ncbi:uncharacterized protein PODANS_5_11800 [Podospora anserina S mat+]|uniref:Podospora anserina S mat+ genomic DNA chromosome 5, supercontig 7 n=1 Tax=Podospora anserina (strain S / ATCC MYA-4624 / DSM 980 / FGSC 10383) TaxID=515849 RepID=B2AFJ5_PODAN|nr:uncharacterized protein PODANS_5_11800 [Podospora anserina S mat+]CAP62214.1 unnamed protein product [Podospora anserina S mat+]CDP29627.1 Putative transporter [Podospora anserina S mat+]
MNIASALTGGFAEDIGVSLDTVNAGNQMMFAGIVLLEIPSNLALQKLGPRKWIAGQVLAFGTVASLQIFIHNKAGFLASRLILGFCESGYIPGAIYTLSTWYAKRELAKRVAILFFGMFGANAISPLLATGILKLDGAGGLHGWQWLFLRLIRFDSNDRDILQKRLERGDNEKKGGAQGMEIPLQLVWKTVTHYRRWPHFISTFCLFSTWSSLTTYTPSILKSLGWDTIAANALAAVGASLSLVFVFIFAYISDKTNLRGGTVILAQVCFLITLIVAREVHPHVGQWSRWALWTAVNALAVGYHPVHNTWLQLNCRSPGERSISIA